MQEMFLFDDQPKIDVFLYQSIPFFSNLSPDQQKIFEEKITLSSSANIGIIQFLEPLIFGEDPFIRKGFFVSMSERILNKENLTIQKIQDELNFF